jgi:hypothetical protein
MEVEEKKADPPGEHQPFPIWKDVQNYYSKPKELLD